MASIRYNTSRFTIGFGLRDKKPAQETKKDEDTKPSNPPGSLSTISCPIPEALKHILPLQSSVTVSLATATRFETETTQGSVVSEVSASLEREEIARGASVVQSSASAVTLRCVTERKTGAKLGTGAGAGEEEPEGFSTEPKKLARVDSAASDLAAKGSGGEGETSEGGKKRKKRSRKKAAAGGLAVTAEEDDAGEGESTPSSNGSTAQNGSASSSGESNSLAVESVPAAIDPGELQRKPPRRRRNKTQTPGGTPVSDGGVESTVVAAAAVGDGDGEIGVCTVYVKGNEAALSLPGRSAVVTPKPDDEPSSVIGTPVIDLTMSESVDVTSIGQGSLGGGEKNGTVALERSETKVPEVNYAEEFIPFTKEAEAAPAAALVDGATSAVGEKKEADGASDLDNARVEALGRRPFWMESCSRIVSPLLRLHQEIIELCEVLQPTAEEAQARHDAVAEVSAAVASLWPNARVEVFGSFATGLYVPTSDVDVVVLGALGGGTSVQAALKALAAALQRRGLAQKIQVIAKARVPIIKFETAAYGNLAFDVSFDVANGPQAAAMVKELADRWPPLRCMILVLKLFLQQRELNEVYTGGIGSYALVVMVSAFLQSHQSRRRRLKPEGKAARGAAGEGAAGSRGKAGRRENAEGKPPSSSKRKGGKKRGREDSSDEGDSNGAEESDSEEAGELDYCLGALLVDFMRFYGRELTMQETGIRSSGGGGFFPKRKPPCGKDWFNPERAHLLSVEDPKDTLNDITCNSYNIMRARTAFEFTYQQLSAPARRDESLLARVLRLGPILASRRPSSTAALRRSRFYCEPPPEAAEELRRLEQDGQVAARPSAKEESKEARGDAALGKKAKDSRDGRPQEKEREKEKEKEREKENVREEPAKKKRKKDSPSFAAADGSSTFTSGNKGGNEQTEGLGRQGQGAGALAASVSGIEEGKKCPSVPASQSGAAGQESRMEGGASGAAPGGGGPKAIPKKQVTRELRRAREAAVAAGGDKKRERRDFEAAVDMDEEGMIGVRDPSECANAPPAASARNPFATGGGRTGRGEEGRRGTDGEKGGHGSYRPAAASNREEFRRDGQGQNQGRSSAEEGSRKRARHAPEPEPEPVRFGKPDRFVALSDVREENRHAKGTSVICEGGRAPPPPQRDGGYRGNGPSSLNTFVGPGSSRDRHVPGHLDPEADLYSSRPSDPHASKWGSGPSLNSVRGGSGGRFPAPAEHSPRDQHHRQDEGLAAANRPMYMEELLHVSGGRAAPPPPAALSPETFTPRGRDGGWYDVRDPGGAPPPVGVPMHGGNDRRVPEPWFAPAPGGGGGGRVYEAPPLLGGYHGGYGGGGFSGQGGTGMTQERDSTYPPRSIAPIPSRFNTPVEFTVGRSGDSSRGTGAMNSMRGPDRRRPRDGSPLYGQRLPASGSRQSRY